jgi:hypothetical protein
MAWRAASEMRVLLRAGWCELKRMDSAVGVGGVGMGTGRLLRRIMARRWVSGRSSRSVGRSVEEWVTGWGWLRMVSASDSEGSTPVWRASLLKEVKMPEARERIRFPRMPIRVCGLDCSRLGVDIDERPWVAALVGCVCAVSDFCTPVILRYSPSSSGIGSARTVELILDVER